MFKNVIVKIDSNHIFDNVKPPFVFLNVKQKLLMIFQFNLSLILIHWFKAVIKWDRNVKKNKRELN